MPLLVGFAVLMTIEPDGVGRILTFMLCVVASDVGGYAAGVIAGRHPMAPTISPKKSWEGFAGSQVAGMVAGALCTELLLGTPWYFGALLGALMVCTATRGRPRRVPGQAGPRDQGHGRRRCPATAA